MKIHISTKEELRERLRVYRPMQLYYSGDPMPLQFCRCASIFVHFDYTEESGCYVICWYDNDGHCIETFVDPTIQLEMMNETEYSKDKWMWSDKYMLDDIIEKYISFVPTETQ
jgi:hypothetical protein